VAGKARVHELAKELGVDSKTVLAKLKEMGEFVKSASSTVEPAVARRLRGAMAGPITISAIRESIVAGHLDGLVDDLRRLKSEKPEQWLWLSPQISGLIDHWTTRGGADRPRVEWLTGVWAAIARPDDGTSRSPLSSSTTASRVAFTRPVPPAKRPSPPAKRPVDLGSQLEVGIVDVLRQFFVLAAADLGRLRRQASGTQFGHDIEFEARDALSGTLQCHVECKNYTGMVRTEHLAAKLLQQFVHWKSKPIDYFILISPRSTASNELSHLVQECNHGRLFPFQILLWDADSGVSELLRLAPGVYREIYGSPAPRLTVEEKTTIVHSWRQRLVPLVRLPKAWRSYLTTPELHHVYGESGFEAVRRNAIPLGALTDSGAPIPGTLLSNVLNWLADDEQRPLLLLAEFGDGKSFFGYELGLYLADRFLAHPDDGLATIRIPLRGLRELTDPAAALRKRLDEIGVSPAEWEELSRRYGTLVILDGFDEISARLDPATLAANIKMLVKCVRAFSASKVLITSRTHFFEYLSDYEEFLQVLNGPRILRIAPIPLRERLEHLAAYAAEIGQLAKFEKLKSLYDPIGLAAKPLFLQMIKDTLPTLPEEGFTEVILYRQYIQDCIRRKAADLEPDRHMSADRLVENIEKVLETLAVQLHLSDTDYVNLRDFDTGERQGLAEMLWAMSGAPGDESATPDAKSRIGVRSLLKPVAGVDRERWPVDFFHRSMREFFVARALLHAIATDSSNAKRLLERVPLQAEIVDFVRLITDDPAQVGLSKTKAEIVLKLVSLAKSAILSLCTRSSLGGNALTLVYALTRQIPGEDWSGLCLDGADLSGATLDRLSFHRSSLRGAVLDNVSLVETDLRDADLTGVQLEQTAPVLALTFDAGSNVAYAAYGDNTIRRWSFGVGGRISCQNLAELDFSPASLHLSPFGDLMVAGSGWIAVLSALGVEETWRVVSTFSVNGRAENFAVHGDRLVVRADGSEDLQFYDPVRRKFGECLVLGRSHGRAVLVADRTTLSVIGRKLSVRSGRDSMMLDAPEVVSMAGHLVDDQRLLVAIGDDQGDVSLSMIDFKRQTRQELWRRRAHAGSVTDVQMSGMFILTGGMDRTVCLFQLSDGWSTGEPLRLHRTIACSGLRIEGARGLPETALLRSMIVDQSEAKRATVPTPGEVFGARRPPTRQ
jgi:hypothetical protein